MKNKIRYCECNCNSFHHFLNIVYSVASFMLILLTSVINNFDSSNFGDKVYNASEFYKYVPF